MKDKNYEQLLEWEGSPVEAIDIETALEQFKYTTYDLGNPDTPVYEHKEEIMAALRDNQVVIVVAETGSGKSTQLPQIVLEAGYRSITLTQPRRPAAANVAGRVREELEGIVGKEEAEKLVSCQTGGGFDGSPDARIKVVTDGLHFVRDARNRLICGDDVLAIDEVHEWNKQIEYSVVHALERARRDPHFRQIIMSATMQKEELVEFYQTKYGIEPAVVEVKGRMHEVGYHEAPDSTVAKEAVKAAKDIFDNPDDCDGAKTIQVFVAGKQEIYDTLDELARTLPPAIRAKTQLVPLHAQMTRKAQEPAFEDYEGIKIVVETKIGQTSLTIKNTRHVISSGLERREELDDEGYKGLMLRPVSQDDIWQQAGRTGRTNPGHFTLTRQDLNTPFIGLRERPERATAEIYRSDLDREVLLEASDGQDISELSTFHKAPEISIQRAKRRLRIIGALDGTNNITKLGRRMAAYPLTPSRAKSMVYAEQYPATIRAYMAMIAAAKEAGDIRLFERQRGRRWEALSQETSSDDLAQLDVFIAAQTMTPEQIYDHDLDLNNLDRAREHYRKVAKKAGADPYLVVKPPTEAEREQLRECILAGSVNNIFLPEGAGLWRILGESATKRELSNRSRVRAEGGALVGDPRRVEVRRSGVTEIKHIIENATCVSVSDIGRVATHLVRWEPTVYRMRKGVFVQVESQKIDIFKLGEREVPAEPSPILRQHIIDFVKANPGPHLRGLYPIKRRLEELAHKSKNPIPHLTDERINDMIAAAAPDSITDPSLIDNNIRIMIEQEGITLDRYLSPEQIQHIEESAPPTISVGDITFKLRYQRGKATAKEYTDEQIEGLEDDLVLPDGRMVRFNHEGKPFTLRQLQNILRAERRL